MRSTKGAPRKPSATATNRTGDTVNLSTIQPLQPVALRALTLDQLWAEAETLGNLSVRTSYHGWKASGRRDGYTVTLKGVRKHTEMEIERKHASLHCAIADCINEAREMGLGEPS